MAKGKHGRHRRRTRAANTPGDGGPAILRVRPPTHRLSIDNDAAATAARDRATKPVNVAKRRHCERSSAGSPPAPQRPRDDVRTFGTRVQKHTNAPTARGPGVRSATEVVEPGFGGAIVYWLLVTMAVAAFVPCIILPEWRKLESVDASYKIEAERVRRFRQVIEDERRALEAIRTDPAVIARLARRDLGYRESGERFVSVAVNGAQAANPPVFEWLRASPKRKSDEPRFAPEPLAPPRFAASLVSRLPQWDYDALFCNDQTRTIIMSLSIALIAMAYALFGRASNHRSAANSFVKRRLLSRIRG